MLQASFGGKTSVLYPLALPYEQIGRLPSGDLPVQTWRPSEQRNDCIVRSSLLPGAFAYAIFVLYKDSTFVLYEQ
jgi:hypothetical protein